MIKQFCDWLDNYPLDTMDIAVIMLGIGLMLLWVLRKE